VVICEELVSVLLAIEEFGDDGLAVVGKELVDDGDPEVFGYRLIIFVRGHLLLSLLLITV